MLALTFVRPCGVAGGVAHQDRPILHAPGPGVLGDGVSLHPDDVATLDARGGAVADALLVALDALPNTEFKRLRAFQA